MVTGTNLSLPPTTEKTKLLSSSRPREEGKEWRDRHKPCKTSLLLSWLPDTLEQMLGSTWLLARVGSSCGSISLILPICTEFYLCSGSLAFPGTARGDRVAVLSPSTPAHRVSHWLDSVLLCGHKYSSPSGHRQLHTQSQVSHSRNVIIKPVPIR